MKSHFFFPFSLAFFLIVAPRVSAHGINVIARVEGDRILTESYFSSNIKVIDGQIKVFGPNSEQLLDGKTDTNGMFSFKIPQETDLRIVLESAMGHRAETVLKADEIRGKSLSKIQKVTGPGLLELILGLGVIFGLMGLTLYLRSRKKKSNTQKKDRFA
jgi:nickel transport protein